MLANVIERACCRIGNHFRSVIRDAVILLSLSALLSAQNPAPSIRPSTASDSNSVATFHATSRLVLVDVVATDKNGKFVSGLTPDDFTVLEDGKPQRISGFSAHVEDTTAGRCRPSGFRPINTPISPLCRPTVPSTSSCWTCWTCHVSTSRTRGSRC